MSNNITYGLYLRDIAETRLGSNAYDFIKHNDPPEHDEYCLSLIGTECILCLQLPTQVYTYFSFIFNYFNSFSSSFLHSFN